MSQSEIEIMRIDAQTGRREWHTLREWNQINGYEAIEGDVMTAEDMAAYLKQREMDDNPQPVVKRVVQSPKPFPSVHGRLTPCPHCGEVYGPGMSHRC